MKWRKGKISARWGGSKGASIYKSEYLLRPKLSALWSRVERVRIDGMGDGGGRENYDPNGK